MSPSAIEQVERSADPSEDHREHRAPLQISGFDTLTHRAKSLDHAQAWNDQLSLTPK